MATETTADRVKRLADAAAKRRKAAETERAKVLRQVRGRTAAKADPAPTPKDDDK